MLAMWRCWHVSSPARRATKVESSGGPAPEIRPFWIGEIRIRLNNVSPQIRYGKRLRQSRVMLACTGFVLFLFDCFIKDG